MVQRSALWIQKPAIAIQIRVRLVQVLAITAATATYLSSPAIARLVEHQIVDLCSNQMVPGSIPGGKVQLHHCKYTCQMRLITQALPFAL